MKGRIVAIERKVFFDVARLNEIAWSWGDAAEVDPRVTSFWFETDGRQDLLCPRKYFAYHISIRDEAYYAFVESRGEFIAKAGAVKSEATEKFAWPYAPSYGGEKVAEADRCVFASWLTFDDGTKIDLILERHSTIRNIPRAFCRPLLKKELPFETLRQHRVGRANRCIQHRPVRPKETRSKAR